MNLDFQPPWGLQNPHLQTIASSLVRKKLAPNRYAHFLAQSQPQVHEVEGVKLKVELTPGASDKLVMIVPGWLGSSSSSYVIATGAALWQAGYTVVRINLRDHGDTATMNSGLFHSALIEEVVGLANLLKQDYQQAGLLGFSLGGNFALRLARAIPDLHALAICPALEPKATMHRIDQNPIYQGYFIRKWRALWAAKQAAFPQLYDFSNAMNISSVSALTDYFIRYHTDFPSTDEYFQAYDLSGDALNDVTATIITADDDPIISISQYRRLPDSIDFASVPAGGHTAFIKNWRLDSWIDDYAVAFCQAKLGSHEERLQVVD